MEEIYREMKKPMLDNVYSNILFGVVLSLAAIIFLFIKYKGRNNFMYAFPHIKLRLVDIAGHLKVIPRGPLHRSLHPENVYFFQILTGFSALFRKEKYFSFWLSFYPVLVLQKADVVEQLLRSTTLLEKAWIYQFLHPWLGTGLLTSKGVKWKSRRKLLTPAFHFDILKDFIPAVNKQSQVLIDILEDEMEKEWIDIVHPLSLCSLDIIGETTLGVSIEAQKNSTSEYVQAVLRTSKTIVSRLMSPFLFLDIFFYNTPDGIQFKKDIRILHNFTRKVIQERKTALFSSPADMDKPESKRKALLDLMLYHQAEHGDLTEDDINEEIHTFAFEGHDTTSMGMSWTLYLVGLYPEVKKKIQEELDRIFSNADCDIEKDDLSEMKYLECVIKEALRLYPSVPFFGREVHKDTVIDGKILKKGSMCLVWPYVLHRDENVFPNPETFDPDRFLPEATVGRHPYAYIPFAAGPRNCIGQRFAMMEMKMVLATVLRRLDVQSLESRDKVHLAADLILRSVYPLKMKISKRKATS